MATSKTQAGATTKPPRTGTKLDLILKQLNSPKGTWLDRMVKATGWQAHTVRAALTGLRKRGYEVRRSTTDRDRSTYAIGER